MPLLEDGRSVADPWIAGTDGQPVPDTGPVLVPLERLRAENAALTARGAPLGVALPNDAEVSDLIALLDGDVNRLDLITLTLPAFKDGRAYSQARQLRETHGYRGRLRAVGEVLRDQLAFLARCGVDAVEIDHPDAEALWRAAVGEIDAVYQPTGDGRTPIPALRRHISPARREDAA
ncbi:DUF934 domain-containing protein [Roseospira visakhapatnamensis]|uniref:Uncharacterized protein (DUF934 family) n=1 Tax=Roseospira visakhapatnamensis TaxID=390880 RepID=A0A7W6RE72_9PROT|nr:DUF934 domain-containing protein [Roseospira visakhapatnamensis]MBB4266416.1 uncharacterized protein (DUF934 family) [Roseospira visakhapatnamensis]